MQTCRISTKTISIDMEAYERLSRARKSPSESFSKVIKRAQWPEDERTARGLLHDLESAPVADRETIERLDRVQKSDAPPQDPWSTD
ncbi:MAG: antitoxin VapB family protein [Acidimicrobiia bacterium]